MSFADRIPRNIMAGIREYVETHTPPGSFLTAVFCNDLTNAVARADKYSLAAIRDIVLYVHNECPSACHGSAEAFKNWTSYRVATKGNQS